MQRPFEVLRNTDGCGQSSGFGFRTLMAPTNDSVRLKHLFMRALQLTMWRMSSAVWPTASTEVSGLRVNAFN